MEISYSDYHDLISRIENLERSNLGEYALLIPLCVIALVLVVFTLYFIALCIDKKKR